MKLGLLFLVLLGCLVPTSHAQVNLTDLDDSMTNWQVPPCIGPPCAGGVGTPSSYNQSPGYTQHSIDGQSMLMAESGTNYSNITFVYNAGSQNAVTYYSGSFQIYIPSTSPFQSVGVDMYHFVHGIRYMFGTECDLAGLPSGVFWRIWDELHGNWILTSAPCTLTQGSFHSVLFKTHRVLGDLSCSGVACEYYDSFVVDGVELGPFPPQPAGTTTSGDKSGIQFDLNSNSAGGTLNIIVDKLNYSSTLPPSISQVYSARTDLIAQPYPVSIPCPGPACGTFGTFTGANFQFTPSDFSTPFIRLTDNSTTATNHTGFSANCDDSSEGNDFNTLSNRIVICQKGNIQTILSFNTATLQETQIANGTWGLANSFTGGQAFYSYTQPYTLYHSHPCQASIPGCAQHDLTIFQADTSGVGNPPTPTVVVDLNTACGLPNYASPAFEDGVTVSRDDRTFSFNVCNSGSCGQGSAGNIIAGVWNRTSGCSYLNTKTWQVFNNGVLLGTAGGTPQNFVMHNARITQDGSFLRINKGTCTSCVSGQNWLLWTPFTTTIAANTDLNGCGHLVNGYSHIANKCQGTTNINGMGYYPFASINTWTSLPSLYPSPSTANEAHLNWSNDNLSDTNPFFVAFGLTSNFAATFPWDNEILGVSTDGSGKVYRFAHNYTTPTTSAFVPINASQDGKYLLLSTDWNQMLGCSNGTTLGCGPKQPDWVSGKVYASTDLITPLAGNPGGFSYQSPGGTAGGIEPSPWNPNVGGVSFDGGLIWTNVGQSRVDVFLLPLPTGTPVGTTLHISGTNITISGTNLVIK